jgi:hypothetical protein
VTPRNLHLITYRTSTGRPAESAATPTEEGNAVNENSSSGQPDDSPRLSAVEEEPRQFSEGVGFLGTEEFTQEQPSPLLGFLAGVQQTFYDGLREKLPELAQVRAAALHTASLVLGPGSSTGDKIVVAQFMLGEGN